MIRRSDAWPTNVSTSLTITSSAASRWLDYVTLRRGRNREVGSNYSIPDFSTRVGSRVLTSCRIMLSKINQSQKNKIPLTLHYNILGTTPPYIKICSNARRWLNHHVCIDLILTHHIQAGSRPPPPLLHHHLVWKLYRFF